MTSNFKVMNCFDLTCRLVEQLKRDEAVIGGIWKFQFRSVERRSTPAEFLHAWQHGSDDFHCGSALRWRNPAERSSRWKAMDRC